MKFTHLAELQQLSEAKVKKFFTLTIPAGCNATEADIEGDEEGDKSFIQNQTVVTVEYIKKNGNTVKVYPMMDLDPDMSDEEEQRLQKAFDKWCANLKEELITEVQVRLKPKTRVKGLDHFGSETDNPQGHKDIKNAMKFLGIDSLAKDKLHSIDAEADAADFKKHARNLGFKELEYPGNNDAKLAGFERVGVKNGTTFWKKGNALLVLGDSPIFMIKDGGKLSEMREGPDVQDLDDDIEFESVDFKTDPSEVLDTVDKQLKSFGLEVVTHETGGDDYAWSISKIGQKVDESKLVEGSGGLQRSVENWMDVNKAYSFEGPRGVRNLTKLAGALGYSSLDDFLEDNSGAIEAVVEWIGSQNVPEWKEKLKA